MLWIIAGFIVAGFVATYAMWAWGGARAANPDWNIGEQANDGETGGFESDWDHYKERKTEGDGPGWDS